MQHSATWARALGSAAVLFAVTGCAGAPGQPVAVGGGAVTQSVARGRLEFAVARSGAASPVSGRLVGTARRPNLLRYATPAAGKKGFTFVSQFSGPPVQEYHKNNKDNGAPLCALPGSSVNGIAVDPAGNLWVPSGTGGGAGYTQEYAANCGAAKAKVVDPNGQPADVGFDHHGDLYIMNIFGAGGAAGSVNIYDKAGPLTGSLSDPTFNELIGIATDSHDDIFVSNRQSNGDANVVEFAAGKMPGTVLTSIVLGLPGAPQLDRKNNLIITDWEAYTLNVYAPPYTGAPTVTSMQGLSLWCPLDRNERQLYCADLGNGSVDVYEYPSGAYAYSYTNGLSPSGFATGIANQPAAPL